MEEKYQDALEKIFDTELLEINVKYVSLRNYEVQIEIKFLNEVKAIKLPFVYDAKYTFESNICGLKNIIENEIIKLFERK